MTCTRCRSNETDGNHSVCEQCRAKQRRILGGTVPEDQHTELLKQWAEGESATELAQRFRVPVGHINDTVSAISKPRFLTFLGPSCGTQQ